MRYYEEITRDIEKVHGDVKVDEMGEDYIWVTVSGTEVNELTIQELDYILHNIDDKYELSTLKMLKPTETDENYHILLYYNLAVGDDCIAVEEYEQIQKDDREDQAYQNHRESKCQ